MLWGALLWIVAVPGTHNGAAQSSGCVMESFSVCNRNPYRACSEKQQGVKRIPDRCDHPKDYTTIGVIGHGFAVQDILRNVWDLSFHILESRTCIHWSKRGPCCTNTMADRIATECHGRCHPRAHHGHPGVAGAVRRCLRPSCLQPRSFYGM